MGNLLTGCAVGRMPFVGSLPSEWAGQESLIVHNTESVDMLYEFLVREKVLELSSVLLQLVLAL